MSATPPGPSKPSPTGPSATGPSAGDGVHVAATDVRGATRTGRNIWILVISLALAVVVMIGYWLLHAPHFQSISHPQVRDESARDANSYQLKAGGARGAPGGEPYTSGNTQ